jgi:hypothetical protein
VASTFDPLLRLLFATRIKFSRVLAAFISANLAAINSSLGGYRLFGLSFIIVGVQYSVLLVGLLMLL